MNNAGIWWSFVSNRRDFLKWDEIAMVESMCKDANCSIWDSALNIKYAWKFRRPQVWNLNFRRIWLKMWYAGLKGCQKSIFQIYNWLSKSVLSSSPFRFLWILIATFSAFRFPNIWTNSSNILVSLLLNWGLWHAQMRDDRL